VLDAIAHEPALTLAVPGTPNLLPVFAPPLVETGHVAQADAAEDGCCDLAVAAAPPPESSVTGFGRRRCPNQQFRRRPLRNNPGRTTRASKCTTRCDRHGAKILDHIRPSVADS
jgi:hypothetical protein